MATVDDPNYVDDDPNCVDDPNYVDDRTLWNYE
jgi:hypothetical protein